MTRNSAVALVATIAMAIPLALSAQTVGVGVRAGTLGLGGEVTVRVTNNIALRGGYGVVPFDLNAEFEEVEYTVEPTSPFANVGVDFFPFRGGFRLSGGLMFLQQPSTLRAEFTGEVEVGDETYTSDEVHALIGTLDHGSMAPYVTIGFGRTFRRGLGLFLDLGAAYMLDEATFTLDAEGPMADDPEFRAQMQREEQRVQEDAGDYLRLWPILSIGLRFGLF